MVTESGVSQPRYPVDCAGPVESAVAAEIEALADHSRPGIEAACLALAQVLDNPKATSTKPTAAAQLMRLLEQLRKGSVTKPKLAAVRALTSKKEK